MKKKHGNHDGLARTEHNYIIDLTDIRASFFFINRLNELILEKHSTGYRRPMGKALRCLSLTVHSHWLASEKEGSRL